MHRLCCLKPCHTLLPKCVLALSASKANVADCSHFQDVLSCHCLQGEVRVPIGLVEYPGFTTTGLFAATSSESTAGKPSLSRYRVLARYQDSTLVEVGGWQYHVVRCVLQQHFVCCCVSVALSLSLSMTAACACWCCTAAAAAVAGDHIHGSTPSNTHSHGSYRTPLGRGPSLRTWGCATGGSDVHPPETVSCLCGTRLTCCARLTQS